MRKVIYLPIIFVSALPELKVSAQALAAGAIGFLGKPFSDEKLIAFLNKAIVTSSWGVSIDGGGGKRCNFIAFLHLGTSFEISEASASSFYRARWTGR